MRVFRTRFARSLPASAIRLLFTLLLAGFLGATLVWFAPGLDSTEQSLDTRLTAESLERLRNLRPGESLTAFYFDFLSRAIKGDLGISRTFNRPNREIISERLPVSIKSAGQGLLAAWLCGLVIACAGVFSRTAAYRLAATMFAGSLLCLPSALIALACLRFGAPVWLGIAAVVFPKIFRYCNELLAAGANQDHVLAARAKGLSRMRVLFWHVMPPALPPLLALAGVSLSLALGAAIPVEVLCDSPGIGQLAWRAALGRDLSLLVALTLVITAITLAANSLADVAVARTMETRA